MTERLIVDVCGGSVCRDGIRHFCDRQPTSLRNLLLQKGEPVGNIPAVFAPTDRGPWTELSMKLGAEVEVVLVTFRGGSERRETLAIYQPDGNESSPDFQLQ